MSGMCLECGHTTETLSPVAGKQWCESRQQLPFVAGLDRLMAIVCETDSIRDVIAFPKSHDGKDPMSKAPASVPQSDLDAYHIAVKKNSA